MLLKRHQLPLYTYVAEILQDKSAALDVVQETFSAAVRHISSLRDDRRFVSWIFGIAHQKCIQHWRRLRREDDVFAAPADDVVSDATDWEGGDPRALLLQREQANEFFLLVERLPVPQRSTLLLHILEDFSLEEIASITGAPVGTVKSRLYHGKRALRALVEAAK
jgi:RNA polymerase sigma-70 factor (ECF subfamily)